MRETIYSDSRITVVTGIDHAVGLFYQIFDDTMIDGTPEGEGLVLDWSELFGYQTNFTGFPKELGVKNIIELYIESYGGESEKED